MSGLPFAPCPLTLPLLEPPMRTCYPARLSLRLATIYRLSVWRNGAGQEWRLYVPTGNPEHWPMSNLMDRGPFMARRRR